MRVCRTACQAGLALVMLAFAHPSAWQEAAAQETAATLDDPAAETARQVAVLQGLDKITARISTFDAPLDEVVAFGSLKIRVNACRKRPPEEPPESAAFLEVIDDRPDSEPIPVFSGWMFASSPALSALEHAVYDVWVLDCKTVSVELPDAAASDESPAGVTATENE